jgi:superfamily I DNA/RNA helicase
MIRPDDIAFATDDVIVYLAAAGSGKTSALVDEATRLLETYRPDEIAFVTFTRRGVINGRERVLQANPQLSADDLPYFKTLHALCFRELGLARASIMDRDKIKEFNRQHDGYFHLSWQEAFDNQTEDDRLLSRYGAIRSGSTKGVYVHDSYDTERYALLTKQYENFKAKHSLVDFYDCLMKFREANRPVANVKAAFIDEAQDLTLLQWEVCQIAFSRAEKVRIAGDDYQSLFAYAGASPSALVSLADRHRSVKLEISHRLPGAVYRFAKGITRLITEKIDKDFKPAKAVEGFVEEVGDRRLLMRRIRKDLADNGPAPRRWYLLFRNNCFIEEAADLLEQYSIPYHTSQGFCVPEKALAKIKRFYNFRKQGFGGQDALDKFCKDHNIKDIEEDFTESDLIPSGRKYVYYDYARKFGVDELVDMSRREPFLLLSTTHRVKGGEADFVVVFLDCTRSVVGNKMFNMDEELRTLYVACTRAKLGLFLAPSKGRHGLDDVIDAVKEQMP